MQRAAGHGAIPEGWQRMRLGDVADFQQGGTPAKANPEYWDGNIPFVTGADLGNRWIGRESARSLLTEKGLNSGSTAVCAIGVLLLATRTRVGLVGIAREVVGASQDITLITPKDAADHSYLYWLLDNRADELQRMSRGTTIQGVTREDVGSLPILLPPLPEQRAIAAVLDSIDGALEGAEAVIAATRQLRDSLLHDLLTRGLPGQHTEWRDVPGLGTIPADWEVVRLGDVATLQRGIDLPESDRIPGGIPVYGSNGILGFHNYAPIEGPGVITGRSGSIGAVYFCEGAFWPLNTTLYVKDFHGNLERFIFYMLANFELARFAASTGVPSLNRNFVHPLPVPVPPLAEQRVIASILDEVDSAVGVAGEELAGLRSLKESAADSLLTGHLRLVS